MSGLVAKWVELWGSHSKVVGSMCTHINPLLSLCGHVSSSWDNAQIDIEICGTALNIAFAIHDITIYELRSAQAQRNGMTLLLSLVVYLSHATQFNRWNLSTKRNYQLHSVQLFCDILTMSRLPNNLEKLLPP